jgi:cyclin-D1-binding protein 1
MESLATLATSHSNTTSAPVDVLRKDALSLHRLIHNSTTRLSVSLGKPPPSYSIAKVPLKDLGSQVAQLTSCTCSFPPGVLRKEAVWAAEVTIRALETLVQHFESQYLQDEFGGDEYLAKTGAIHDAVVKAEQMSSDETEAIVKVWKLNGESLDDSLREVREMMEKKDVDKDDVGEPGEEGGDGWDEVGEGFGGALNPEEIKRVEKVCGARIPLQAFS